MGIKVKYFYCTLKDIIIGKYFEKLRDMAFCLIMAKMSAR